MLESLSPVERAVYLLRELFGYEYAEISDIINKSEANCRKIAQRAREYIKLQRPRFSPDKEKQHELLQSFKKAIARGDVDQLKELLAEEAVLYSDGGGKRTAARKPIYGDDKISRFIMGIASKERGNFDISPKIINNLPGFSVSVNDELHGIWSFHIYKGKISNIYVVLNPDKLRHLK
ncbi:MAG: hypothetical protein FH748_13440 [Balneolaceae bacterium]|nr:hypothetical protein [Balneolaceae bacterium]